MKPNAYKLLDQCVQDGLALYLTNRVNKHTPRIQWVQQLEVDGPVEVLDDPEWERVARIVADEAAEEVMNAICEWFDFEHPNVTR